MFIERPKAPPGVGVVIKVTERRLDGFTVSFEGAIGSKEQKEDYLKNMKWRVKGMVSRTAK